MSTLWSYLLITACLLYGLGADETSETTRGRPFRRRKGPFHRRYGEGEEEQAETKAQCKKPTIEHVERFSEDKEFYDSYESIKVHCKSGYYPSSDTMMCYSPGAPQEWMPSTVTCLPQCSRPAIENMERISEDKEYYEKYDTAEVWCKPGFDPESFTMTCMKPQTSKEWTNIGTCKAQCKQPTIKNVGRLLPRQAYYNEKEVLSILCKPGYSPTSDTMRCENPNTPQEWKPPIVSCKARCKRPVIEHMLNPYPYKMSYDEEEEVRVDCKSRHYPSYDTTRCVHPLTPQEWIPAVTCIGMTVMEKVASTSVSVWMSCTPSECPDHWRLEVELCDVHYGLCKTLDTKGNATFTDLQPSYDYTIGITHHNNRTQTKMVPRLIKTNQPVSGQFNIMKFPTMEDSTMRWSVPYKWENITGFNLTVSARRDYDRSFALDDSIWFPPSVTEHKIPFQYGATYTISLRAFTSAGAERIREWITETDIGDPPQHPKDTLRGNTLQLNPVPATNGPISSFEVIVYPAQDRNLSMDCLGFINTPYNSSLTLSGYTAAVLPAETLTEPRTFTLGDNHHYNGFHNAPLIPNHNYTIYIRVTSRWNHVEKSSCAFAGFLKKSAISMTPIIAGSIAAVFLLLILLFLVILWRSHSSRKSRRSSNIPLKAQTGLGKKRDIPVDKFPEVVKNFRKSELADHDEDEEENANLSPVGRYLEYQDLPGGFMSSCAVGQAEENQAKNRYKKVVPYDDSRVVLRSSSSRSDYINASYINGYKAPKLYIATQGPLPETLADFWSMVWQENSSVIVMLTGLQEKTKVKCECYWPEQSQTYGDITVSVQKIIQTGAITIRSFSLKKVQSMVQITVEHLQYLRWPDHGVPRNTSDLVQLIELMNKCNTPGSGPVVVHCSAGIGRTGTFIALDILLKMAHAVNKVNLYNCVSELRKKRVKMVQEKEQYIFLYDALLEALLCGNTIVPVSDIQKHIGHMSVRDGKTNMSGYDKEFQDLEKLKELYQIYQCKEGKKPENQEKNRNPDILPGDHWRPALMSALNTRGAPGYINAVFVNSNSKEEVLIATQLPMKQTLADFWALVWDYKCTVMVMMQRAQDLQENGCWFFPDKGETGYGIYKVRMTARASRNGFTGLTLSLRKTNETYNNSMEVKLWCLDSWPLGKPLPENPAAVISLIGEVEKHQMTVPESHILVTCCDGASRSGLFCAGIVLCEQIRSDGCLDVSQAVRSLRRRRCQFIPNVEQYSFCYTLAQSYLDSFETYGNFK